MTTEPDQRWRFHANVVHPDFRDKEVGATSKIVMNVNRRLKSGKMDFENMTVEEALLLAQSLLQSVNIVMSKP